MTIEPATPGDLPEVLELLERHQLPLDGVRDHVATMIVARDRRRLIGAAAIEPYADGALLRSVVVERDFQGQHIGRQLTAAALDMARQRGMDTVFLLTTTAERFFPRFGFEPITRAEVPLSVRASIEFHSACPESAVVMRKRFAE